MQKYIEAGDGLICPRCLNEEAKYFHRGSKGFYCRKCVVFGRVLIEEEIDATPYYQDKIPDSDYTLSFNLTPAQKKASEQLCLMVQAGDVLVHAACGAGKTEIIFECVKRHLEKGLSVGIAIPRRQVVIEIGQRLKTAFSKLNVVWVCGGHTENVNGDLIVCTTHQLYRYFKRFDLLVLDEPDAFPYNDNKVLKGIVKTSCRGKIVYLTATPDEELLKLPKITLFKRPHGHPLVEPVLSICPSLFSYVILLHWLKGKERTLIFVPTIRMSKRLAAILRVPAFHSGTESKDEIIEGFRNNTWKYLVCTTILERGITIRNVNVCVFHGDHHVFTHTSLIQIMGRIGRDFNHPGGSGLIITRKKTRHIDRCIRTIRTMNA